jgi:hypothetical protein
MCGSNNVNKSLPEKFDSTAVALSVVLVLWVVLSLLNYVWIAEDTWYPFTDSSDFFDTSNAIYRQGGGSIVRSLGAAVDICTFRPPLVFLGPLPFFNVLGATYKSCLVPNAPYLLILMLSVYGAGSIMFGKTQGLLATFLVSTHPEIISLSRIYMLDLPMMAAIALSIYVLLLTNRFRSLPYSLLFGAVFGIALLVKWTSLVFIVPPALVWFLWPSKEDNGQSTETKRVRNALLAGVVSLLFVSWWILPNLKPVTTEVFKASFGSRTPQYSLGVPFFHPKRFLYYPIVALSQDFVFFWILGIGLALFIANRWRRQEMRSAHTMLVFAWVLVPFVVFVASPKVWPRFVAPFVPPICLMASAGLLSIKNSRIRHSAVTMSVALCALGVVSLTFAGCGALGSGGEIAARARKIFRCAYPLYEKMYAGHPSVEYFDVYSRPFKEDDWRIDAILADVNGTTDNSDNVTLAILSHHPFFHYGAFKYFSTQLDTGKFSIKMCSWAKEPIDDDVFSSDYAVLKTGFNGGWFAIKEIDRFMERTRSAPETFSSKFAEIAHYALPDGSLATLYKRKTKEEESAG